MQERARTDGYNSFEGQQQGVHMKTFYALTGGRCVFMPMETIGVEAPGGHQTQLLEAEEPPPMPPAGRRSVRCRVCMAVVVLLAFVWPMGYALPWCWNGWPAEMTAASSVDREPGVGTVVGNSQGRLLWLHGALVEAMPEAAGALQCRWYLDGWHGGENWGVGVRQWGQAGGTKRFKQTGVVIPAWLVSGPAMLLLAWLCGRPSPSTG
jgi:hypothetical protein